MDAARRKDLRGPARGGDPRSDAELQCVLAEVQRGVEAGLRLADQQTEDRRQRLQQILLQENEESAVHRAKLAEKAKNCELEQRKRRAEEIKNKKEAERKEIVEKKRIQQYMERCEVIRPMVQQRNLVLTKEAQLGQIREKRQIQQLQKQLQDFWDDAMKRELEAKLEQEMEAARRRVLAEKAAQDFLKEQMKEKEQAAEAEMLKMKEEEEAAVKIKEELRQEEIAHLEEERRKKRCVAADLQRQMEDRWKTLESLELEERLQGEALRSAAEGALDDRRAANSGDKEALRKEIQMFQRSVDLVKDEQRRHEKKLEAKVQEEMDKIQRRREEARAKLQEARHKFLQDTLEGLDQQLEARRLRALEQQLEKAREAEYVELEWQQQLRDKEEHDRRTREFRRQWARDLKEQMEYGELLKRRQQEELRREWRAGQLEEECHDRLLKELMAKSADGPQHPFASLVSGDCPQT